MKNPSLRQTTPVTTGAASTLSAAGIPRGSAPVRRGALAGLLLLALAGCLTTPERPAGKQADACPRCVCPQAPACPPGGEPVRPAAAPLQAARFADLPGWGQDRLADALPALRQSCSVLPRKDPAWGPVCAEALRLDGRDETALRQFFERRFAVWQAANPDDTREGRITGYYEPLLRGSRMRKAPYTQPLLGVPSDLIVVDLGEVLPEVKHLRLRGRLEGRRLVPYDSRAQIDGKLASGKGANVPTLLWVDDAVELFFLQVQGSGRVRLPDGSTVRVGYADQNGHPYRSIGRWLVDQGELTLDQASMQGIKAWVARHPQRLNELLHQNPSMVFFREMPDDGLGPRGALGVPLTPGRSIAVDPRYLPLGAPVWLATTQPASDQPLNRLVLAQDTGGAIRGQVRADYFWGYGSEAGEQAGRMKQDGRLWVLLPVGMKP